MNCVWIDREQDCETCEYHNNEEGCTAYKRDLEAETQ